MTLGAHLTRLFLRRTKQKPADLARQTGIDKSLISRWVREDGRRPGLEHACALEHATRGDVPACSWLVEFRGARAALAWLHAHRNRGATAAA